MVFDLFALFSPVQWSDHTFQVAVTLYSNQYLGHSSDLSSTMMPPAGMTVEKQWLEVNRFDSCDFRQITDFMSLKK